MEGRFRLAGAGIAVAMLALLAGTLSEVPAAAAAGPTGGIAGMVLGHDGSALANATVTAYRSVEPYSEAPGALAAWSLAATTRSGRSGAYTLNGLIDGVYQVKVVPRDLHRDAYGYRVSTNQSDPWSAFAGTVTVSGGLVTSSIDVRLAEPATISGTVTDQNGRPLSGMEARAVRADPTTSPNPCYCQWLPDYSSTRTDDHGRYQLAGLPRSAASPGHLYYGLVVLDPNGTHAPYIWWQPPAPTSPPPLPGPPTLDAGSLAAVEANVSITSGPPVNVTVTSSGHPVAGIQVQPTSAFPYPYLVTNADGVASFASPMGMGAGPLSKWAVYVSDPNGVHHPAFWVQAPKGRPTTGSMTLADATPLRGNHRTDATIALEPGILVTGRALDASQQPVPATVSAFLTPSPADPYRESVGLGTMTDVNGRFALSLWPSQTYWLRVEHMYDPLAGSATFTAGTSNVDVGDITVG